MHGRPVRRKGSLPGTCPGGCSAECGVTPAEQAAMTPEWCNTTTTVCLFCDWVTPIINLNINLFHHKPELGRFRQLTGPLLTQYQADVLTAFSQPSQRCSRTHTLNTLILPALRHSSSWPARFCSLPSWPWHSVRCSQTLNILASTTFISACAP